MNLFRKKTVDEIMKRAGDDASQHGSLAKHLGVRDLTALGIAAIIGAGIFSTIGNASAQGGPGVILLFLFTAIACGFTAFAYAEFASLVPVSGSAYTYSYVAFGEFIAWIIGWALIMEYGIGNITVAISWSDYLTGLLDSMGIHLPLWMTMDYLTAAKGFSKAGALMLSGRTLESLDAGLRDAYLAWQGAPTIGPLHIVADLPALLIILIITWIVYRGIKESKNAGNAMVIIKLSVVLLVIAVGLFYINTDNWYPFLPNGIPGVLKGVSAVFFAYIGFDAISTTAEECKNPQRDLPRGMMWAIIICTILYIAIALVLTGMVNYSTLAVGDPLAYVFSVLNLKWMSAIIAVSAIVAMASVLLVFQLGQPRIWMSMSRDGLLPKKFATIHPKYKTPSFASIVTGFVVAVPALFMNLTMVTDLCSIGTLFAFVLVCAGVLKMQITPNAPRGSFNTPYVNAKYIFPLMLILTAALSWSYNKDGVSNFLKNTPQPYSAENLIPSLGADRIKDLVNTVSLKDSAAFAKADNDLANYFSQITTDNYLQKLTDYGLSHKEIYESGLGLFKHKIPTWIFIISCLYLCVLTWKHNLSLIPLLGLVCCLYMMSEMGISNWIGFSIWLAVGLIIYFGYSYKNSKLNIIKK
ncbi:MAG TPA: amino acid permease [Bacteroidia bacterium]|nr:amino acid permease [Bacteroidia bacterium]QQR95795.1 MAG: amino acid permease [Bacteroidota bacterium]MBP8668795.1 amino acid permease [Bacteroidia bacterium]HOZ90406.1 amino acid permease [Bacteroidia bacterium]HQW16530.1 amino acid permease [Bacteroidia bacterium]